MRRVISFFAGASLFATFVASTGVLHADTLVIKTPGDHPDYVFEAEPHVLLGFVDPPGPANGTGYGLGFRGTVEVFDNGFVQTINNTIGVGFGLDWVHYGRGGRKCRSGPGPGPGPGNCDFIDDDNDLDYFIFPVVMQWNFWLSKNWSVFGEPGVALRFFSEDDDVGKDDDGLNIDPFVFYAGGRWHFADYASLTMRVGYPTFSVGVSFLL